MRTVSDFINAKASLRVVCTNCGHEAYLTSRFLRQRLGLYAKVLKAKFKCTKFGSQNVRLAAASEAGGANKHQRMEYFGGTYEGLDD